MLQKEDHNRFFFFLLFILLIYSARAKLVMTQKLLGKIDKEIETQKNKKQIDPQRLFEIINKVLFFKIFCNILLKKFQVISNI